MKNYVFVFFAALIAFALALFGYDHFIVQPRALAQAQAVTKAAQLDLSAARVQANEIAATLDESVKKTVADAEAALVQQSGDQEMRRIIADAFTRSSMFKTAIAEAYANYGRWPANAKEAGLANPKEYAGEAVTSIALEANGVVSIALDQRLGTNAKIQLIPKVNAQTMQISWRCVGTNFPELPRYQSVCTSE